MNNSEIIPMASDHAGFELKEYLKQELISQGYNIKDYGTFSTDSCDYPDIIHPIAKDINNGIYPLGIIMCGSGNGVQMTANKYLNVRCALCWNEEISSLARQHNNANICSLPARFILKEEALKIVLIFLNTDYEGGRHQKRVEKISTLLK
ncbi:MAG: RpiB/LacA/LacB family sugar-phosphate isomerase [Bacteroidales bacterium]|nr:RpiB/LacA/LacB family sugar-phosphate isomerase [Bacteroidales bacterium]MDD4529147.1 RpiB/LacA/LacB family sugar-phosphate isomerase [Bacteroidales bacterium]MDD4829384.1 RpiB/LacA/LacB family sugar-phosphate isomerase [Bacteroidales bacterium]